ncbi:MAG: flagellar biosynthesis protein FlhF [Pseudohongiellaceae bacterium]|jgi:flagellar biosynthesis protein FlhF
MTVKRFYAADMHKAMSIIRSQLGDEAIILGSRKLSDGVEVSASKGIPQGLAASAEKAAGGLSQRAGKAAKKPSGESSWFMNSISGFEAEHSAIHSELGGISCLLQNWMDCQGWENFATASPTKAKLWERFRAMGFNNNQVASWLANVESGHDIKQVWQQCLTKIATKLPIATSDLIAQGGVYALLGSAGVGKTTTIGKLATQFVLKHGADSIALITTDRYRIAAHEQLRTFGKILGVSVQAVDESHSLSDLLDALRHKKLVLIDTAGINVKNKHFQQQLDLLSQLRNRIEPILLLSATSQAQVQATEAEAYSAINPVASIVTKVDEAVSLGESLGVLIQANCPIAYTTHGQSVPEDIAVADSVNIVNEIVALSKSQIVPKEEMIAGFGAVYTNSGVKQARAAAVG